MATVEIRRNICNQISLRVLLKKLGQAAFVCLGLSGIAQATIIVGHAVVTDCISQTQRESSLVILHKQFVRVEVAGMERLS